MVPILEALIDPVVARFGNWAREQARIIRRLADRAGPLVEDAEGR